MGLSGRTAPRNRKDRALPKSPENENEKNEYEYIDADAVSYVRRGRKASVDAALVDALRKLPKGRAIALNSLRQDPASDKYAADKARTASAIRTACKAAGLDGFRILWTPTGVPQVVR